jgi:hypothetical protein
MDISVTTLPYKEKKVRKLTVIIKIVRYAQQTVRPTGGGQS